MIIDEMIIKELRKAEKSAGISEEENVIAGFNDVWTHYNMREIVFDVLKINEQHDGEEIVIIENGLDQATNYIVIKKKNKITAYKVTFNSFSKEGLVIEEKNANREIWIDIKDSMQKIRETTSIIRKNLPHCDSESYVIISSSGEEAFVRVAYGLQLIDSNVDEYPILSTYKKSIDNIIDVVGLQSSH